MNKQNRNKVIAIVINGERVGRVSINGLVKRNRIRIQTRQASYGIKPIDWNHTVAANQKAKSEINETVNQTTKPEINKNELSRSIKNANHDQQMKAVHTVFADIHTMQGGYDMIHRRTYDELTILLKGFGPYEWLLPLPVHMDGVLSEYQALMDIIEGLDNLVNQKEREYKQYLNGKPESIMCVKSIILQNDYLYNKLRLYRDILRDLEDKLEGASQESEVIQAIQDCKDDFCEFDAHMASDVVYNSIISELDDLIADAEGLFIVKFWK